MSRSSASSQKVNLYRLGLVLIGLSLALWVAPFAIVFLPLSAAFKTVLITSCIVGAELLFWAGAVLAGKTAALKVWRRLNPKNWRRQTDAS